MVHQQMEKISIATNSALDLSLPTMPVRSKLYHLEPIGLGTSNVESLTGYISRLAETHCISVSSFFKYILAKLINRTHIFSGRAAIQSNLGAMNSIGVRATETVRAVESLTLRNDLGFLTLLPWRNVLVHFGLLTPLRQWCPCCYKEWHAMRQVVYEPLIWVFREVKYCLRHERVLRSQCPFCNRTQPWLARRSRPGYCCKCKTWLGEECSAPISDVNGLLENTELEYQKWCVENIGDMLATAPNLLTQPSRESCTQSLSYCVSRIPTENTIALAELLQIFPQAVDRWKRGEAQPQISAILRMCKHSGISLVDYMTGRLSYEIPAERARKKAPIKYYTKEDWKRVARKLERIISDKQLPLPLSKIAEQLEINKYTLRLNLPDLCNKIVARRKSYQKNRHIIIEVKLNSIIKIEEFPPPSVRQVAKRVQFSEMSLVKNFPAQCKIISARFFEYREALKVERRRELEEEVRQVALNLHEQGIRPSFPNVGECLSVPSRMSYEGARLVLRSVQEELGYR